MPSIKQLQGKLPWSDSYHKDFVSSPIKHKDFAHALLHVQKACGKLASIVDDAEHGDSEFKKEGVDAYIADIVICALRMANTCPSHVIDLESAITGRLEKKNRIKLKFDTEPEKKYTLTQVFKESVEEFFRILNKN